MVTASDITLFARLRRSLTVPIVDPGEFKEVMQKVLSEHEELLRKHWNGKASIYTDKVWGAKNSKTGVIYKAIAKELRMELFQEYWEVDAVYYKKTCNLASIPKSPRATVLSVALDHENFPKGSYREISRLLNRTALLKVLVTYPDEQQEEQEYFNGFTQQIKAVDKVIPGFSKDQKIMTVFGYRKHGKSLIWRYHVYDWFSGKFLLMA